MKCKKIIFDLPDHVVWPEKGTNIHKIPVVVNRDDSVSAENEKPVADRKRCGSIYNRSRYDRNPMPSTPLSFRHPATDLCFARCSEKENCNHQHQT